MMRVLIVDDEPLARRRLVQLLEEIGGYEICGEATNGLDALRQAERFQPDIILMDVRMPGMDGLEAAQQLTELPQQPAIIVVSAFPEHALEAFGTHASGYLLKPTRKEALAEALDRASTPNRAQRARLTPEEEAGPGRSHICAKIGSKLELIPIEDVIYFQADQKYVTVVHEKGEVVIEDSLKSLEDELGGHFLRIHRNALVSTRRLQGIDRGRDGAYCVLLQGTGTRPEVSRRHVSDVKEFIRNRG